MRRVTFWNVAAALQEIFEQIEARYGEQTKAATGVVNDLVFDEPDHAWVLYVLHQGEGSSASPQLGAAVFADGRWKVAAKTYCGLISPSGLSCPPL